MYFTGTRVIDAGDEFGRAFSAHRLETVPEWPGTTCEMQSIDDRITGKNTIDVRPDNIMVHKKSILFPRFETCKIENKL